MQFKSNDIAHTHITRLYTELPFFNVPIVGYQMLRCKLGCSRPSGTKVFNSHYHCCICGAICIRKSGVYEHMRVNHSVQPISKEGLSQLSQNQRIKFETPSKPVVVQVPPVPSGTAGAETRQIQAMQAQTPATQGVVTGASASASPQTVTVQIPQQAYTDGQGQGQGQQQVVILMPQQISQNQLQTQVQAQQPIVIVMPQSGGGQVAQPIVVPVPQAPSNWIGLCCRLHINTMNITVLLGLHCHYEINWY